MGGSGRERVCSSVLSNVQDALTPREQIIHPGSIPQLDFLTRTPNRRVPYTSGRKHAGDCTSGVEFGRSQDDRETEY